MQLAPVKMYGLDASDIKLKPKFTDNVEDLVDEKISDPNICYVYSETGGNDHDYIGIPSGYPWCNEPEIDTELGAAEYIAMMLSPYCISTKAEIIKACHYIEDTYYA